MQKVSTKKTLQEVTEIIHYMKYLQREHCRKYLQRIHYKKYLQR